MFQSVASADREHWRQESYAHRGFGPNSFATIHRTSLLQDGFEQLDRLGDAIKVPVKPRLGPSMPCFPAYKSYIFLKL